MKIRLADDYRGVLTAEKFYRAGVYDTDKDMPIDMAVELVRAGRAEEVETVKPEPVAPTRKVKRSRGSEL